MVPRWLAEKAALQKADGDQTCIKLPIDQIHMRHGIGDDVCGITNTMECPDLSDLQRQLTRHGEWHIWFLKQARVPPLN
jgi:hypothetical protein